MLDVRFGGLDIRKCLRLGGHRRFFCEFCVCDRLVVLTLCCLKLGLCLLELYLQIPGIKIYQRLAPVHELIADDVDLCHDCRHPRTDLDNIPVHKSVVRRLKLPCVKPVDQAADQDDREPYAAKKEQSPLSVAVFWRGCNFVRSRIYRIVVINYDVFVLDQIPLVFDGITVPARLVTIAHLHPKSYK